MLLRDFIEKLDSILDRHGDVRVQVTDNVNDFAGFDVDVEFNDDDKPVCIVSYYPDED